MRYKLESRRGRPNRRYRSQADVQLLEYLAKVSMKYGVDSDKFFDSFFGASRNHESQCEKLSIECRVKEQDYAIFLITRNREVVGQFHMNEYLLNDKTNPLKEFTSRLSTMRTLTQGIESKSYKIGDLRTGMKRLNIKAQVLEVSQPIQIATRSGCYTNLSIALIADETGTINLSLLGSQIKEVNLRDFIQIENAHVAWFRGERQLRIGKHGKISVVQRSRDARSESE
jgi:hypothetical protein